MLGDQNSYTLLVEYKMVCILSKNCLAVYYKVVYPVASNSTPRYLILGDENMYLQDSYMIIKQLNS